MSEASEARLEGFEALLEVDGESLQLLDGTTDRGSFLAIVDRNPIPGKTEHIDFTERDVNKVEFLRTSPSVPPQVGWSFLDQDDRKMRIKNIVNTDFTFVCVCKLSSAA